MLSALSKLSERHLLERPLDADAIAGKHCSHHGVHRMSQKRVKVGTAQPVVLPTVWVSLLVECQKLGRHDKFVVHRETVAVCLVLIFLLSFVVRATE